MLNTIEDRRLKPTSNTYGATLHFPSLLQGKYVKADEALLRVIKVQEKSLGTDHPILSTNLGDRATALLPQVNGLPFSATSLVHIMQELADYLFEQCLAFIPAVR